MAWYPELSARGEDPTKIWIDEDCGKHTEQGHDPATSCQPLPRGEHENVVQYPIDDIPAGPSGLADDYGEAYANRPLPQVATSSRLSAKTG